MSVDSDFDFEWTKLLRGRWACVEVCLQNGALYWAIEKEEIAKCNKSSNGVC